MPRLPLQDGDLHAYVDGRLDPDRRIEVEAWMAEDLEVAARVAGYRAQEEALHAFFDTVLAEPPPPPLVRARQRLVRALAGGEARAPWWSWAWVHAAAAAVLLLVGGSGGYALRDQIPVRPAPQAPTLLGFADAAARAHAFYAAESRFPVEMTADDPGALDAWLSQRLGQAVNAPDLSGAGYHLIGGRSLPISTGAGAQYMYEDGGGRRLTLFVGTPPDGSSSAFSFVQRGSVSLVYWGEGVLAYALIAEMGRDELLEISRAVYQKLRREPLAQTPAPAALEPDAASTGEAAPAAVPAAAPATEAKPM